MYIELKYRPRICRMFCCGECMASKNNSCGRDVNNCIKGFLLTYVLVPLEKLFKKRI